MDRRVRHRFGRTWMTYRQISWLCLLAAIACSEPTETADAGACENEPSCTCGDGLNGRKVCDLDTHQCVMWLCNRARDTGSADAGVTRSDSRDAGMSGRAGRGATTRQRPDAAMSGDPADPGTAARGGGQGGNGADDDPAAGAP